MRLREGLNPKFRKRQKELLIMTTTITGKLYQANGGGNNPVMNYYLLSKKEAGQQLQQIFAENGIKLAKSACAELTDLLGTQYHNIFNRGWIEQRSPQHAFDEAMLIINDGIANGLTAKQAIKNCLA
jgi:hypothetical protein